MVDDFAELFERHWQQSTGGTAIDDYVGAVRDGRRLVSDAPVKDSIVLGRYVDAIAAARRRVWLANAYFYPPPVLLEALVAAARRGVEVKIIVPGVSDLPFIQGAARAQYRRPRSSLIDRWGRLRPARRARGSGQMPARTGARSRCQRSGGLACPRRPARPRPPRASRDGLPGDADRRVDGIEILPWTEFLERLWDGAFAS